MFLRNDIAGTVPGEAINANLKTRDPVFIDSWCCNRPVSVPMDAFAAVAGVSKTCKSTDSTRREETTRSKRPNV